MNYKHALIFYRTVTPLHVGCGQAVGVVDLPVIRERATGYPFIPGSGIRGSLRDIFENKGNGNKELTLKLFGPDNEGMGDPENQYAGSLAIHDARLLFFPVRADKEVFLWITCPLAVQRYNRDRAAFQLGDPFDLSELTTINAGNFIGPAALGTTPQDSLHLEEFLFTPAAVDDPARERLQTLSIDTGKKIGLDELASRAVLVSDRSFYHFVNHATMLTQHNTLTSAKTVKGGMLFSIESLPPETILYGMIGATHERRDPDNGFTNTAVLEYVKSTLVGGQPDPASAYLHLGGKESIGMGVTQLTWASNILGN